MKDIIAWGFLLFSAFSSSAYANGLCTCMAARPPDGKLVVAERTCSSNGATCLKYCYSKDHKTGTFGSSSQDCENAIEISATTGWQSTGISLNPGETVEITYTVGLWNGNVKIDKWHGPNGPTNDVYVAPSSYPLPGVVENSLIGDVGGDVFLVGSYKLYTASRAGQLRLRMNDTGLYDNAGSVFVKIGKK